MADIEIPTLIENLRNRHINFPRDKELKTALDLACEQMWIRKDPSLPHGRRNRHEQDAILVSGATGAGKSCTVSKALGGLAQTLADPTGEPARIVSVKTPSPFSAKELARRILRELEVELSDELTEVELWEAVIANFAGHRVALLHIDEFQRFTTVKTVGRSDAAKSIERLSATLNELLMADEWPVTLLISGTEEIVGFWRMKLVDQVHRRTKFVLFQQLDHRYYTPLRDALNKYCEIAGISNATAVEDLPGRIAMAGENTLGIALELMQEAVVQAVRSGAKALTMDHFVTVYAVRTGLPRDQNPFFAKDWSKIGIREKSEYDPSVNPRKGHV